VAGAGVARDAGRWSRGVAAAPDASGLWPAAARPGRGLGWRARGHRRRPTASGSRRARLRRVGGRKPSWSDRCLR
jgi:hypothetical protein